jgi:TonB family protein
MVRLSGSGRIIAAALLAGCALGLLACTVSSLNADATTRTNEALERWDQGIYKPGERSWVPEQARLWADRPQYTGLPDARPVKRMRLVSAVAPKYPALLQFARVAGTVRVSFVVGPDGRVEDARILESSDARFNEDSLDAIRQFTFLPAQGPDGPVREMAVVPFHFVPHGKAINPPTANSGDR